MTEVFICIEEVYTNHNTNDCWRSTRIEHLFHSLERAQQWINRKRESYFELSKSNGASGKRVVFERWADGDSYDIEIEDVSVAERPVTRYEYYQYSMKVEL